MYRILNSILCTNSSINLQGPVVEQDTTLIPSSKDSAEAKVFGVNPIFIMNERRESEILEAKQKHKLFIEWKLRQKEKTEIDTTCYICPSEKQVFTNNLLRKEIFFWNSSNEKIFLYDKNDYFARKKSEQPVFIELAAGGSKADKNLFVRKKQVDGHDFSFFFFFSILGIFLLLATIKVFYRNFLSSLFQSSIYLFVASKIHRENSLLGQRILLLLDILFFTSVSIFIGLTLNYFGIELYGLGNSYLAILVIILSILLYRTFRFILVRFIGYISNTQKGLEEFFFNQLIYTRILGIIIPPFALLLAYSNEKSLSIVIYSATVLFAITLIMRTMRSIQVFISNGFPIFYFLLYLCALEITPFVILVKEVFWE